jgi:hypothetical protein
MVRPANVHRGVRVFTVVCYAFAYLLFPVYLAPRSGDLDPRAMHAGCATASCCKSRCYLDSNGVHHCVPEDGDSCECGLSARDEAADSIPLIEIAAFAAVASFQPQDAETGEIVLSAADVAGREVATPAPPPRV